MGIKETSEVLDGLKLLATEAGKVLEDGKVNLKDLPVLLDLVQNVGVLKAAVDGAEEAPKEIKDLTQEEVAVLLGKVYEIVAALKKKV